MLPGPMHRAERLSRTERGGSAAVSQQGTSNRTKTAAVRAARRWNMAAPRGWEVRGCQQDKEGAGRRHEGNAKRCLAPCRPRAWPWAMESDPFGVKPLDWFSPRMG